MAFVFRADRSLKARRVAPRTPHPRAARETKYSTLVVDGVLLDPTDVVVIGINQAQNEGSESWWRGRSCSRRPKQPWPEEGLNALVIRVFGWPDSTDGSIRQLNYRSGENAYKPGSPDPTSDRICRYSCKGVTAH